MQGTELDDFTIDEDIAAGTEQPQPEATTLATPQPPPGLAYATFAGGCFWGLELAMQRVVGVEATKVGYTQGQTAHPTYAQV